VTVQLEPAAELVGRVEGAPSSFLLHISPIDRYAAMIFPDKREVLGSTFDLKELPAIPVEILVRTEDGKTGRAEAKLLAGQRSEITVRLGGLGRVIGHLVETGHTGRWVNVRNSRGEDRMGHSDSKGRFEIIGLVPGSHVLTVGPGEGQPVLVERLLAVTAGQVLDLGDVPVPAPH
jgi:hypothetical protein